MGSNTKAIWHKTSENPPSVTSYLWVAINGKVFKEKGRYVNKYPADYEYWTPYFEITPEPPNAED